MPSLGFDALDLPCYRGLLPRASAKKLLDQTPDVLRLKHYGLPTERFVLMSGANMLNASRNAGEQCGLLTRIAATESVLLCARMNS
jgi:hypothetical protein